MSNYYAQYSFTIQIRSREEALWILRAVPLIRERWSRQYKCLEEVEVDYDHHSDEPRAILVHGASCIKDTLDFVRCFLKKFNRGDVVVVHYANTCDKPNPDAFSGGIAVVTKEHVKWLAIPPDLVDHAVSTAHNNVIMLTRKTQTLSQLLAAIEWLNETNSISDLMPYIRIFRDDNGWFVAKIQVVQEVQNEM